MDDETWTSIQCVKSTQSLREKMKKRKAERETILNAAASGSTSSNNSTSNCSPVHLSPSNIKIETSLTDNSNSSSQSNDIPNTDIPISPPIEGLRQIEYTLLEILNEALEPIEAADVTQTLLNKLNLNISNQSIINLIEKLAKKELISIKPNGKENFNIINIEHNKISAVIEENKLHPDSKDLIYSILNKDTDLNPNEELDIKEPKTKILCTEDRKNKNEDDVKSLLSVQSIRERETKKVGEEIKELLSKPTAKEQSLAQRFRSQGGAKVQEFCPHGSTKEECEKQQNTKNYKCGKLHFRKIIQKHTDESLGDCSFLNTCFHMDSCRYVHYEVDYSGLLDQQDQIKQGSPIHITKSDLCPDNSNNSSDNNKCNISSDKKIIMPGRARIEDRTILFPSQWIQCDLRFLDMSILGKFAVIMADPPWDIHMELPYGTMSDDEMRQLSVPTVQDEGLIFLWVTGRAMELGRECLTLWGYERVDEIIWVKTNQLQRIIRTGRTGHWLNHGKEHCLVGMKGNPRINKWLDCDVIVAEVRATSHKPDEIYGIIERLSPGTRKLELFGRPHNVQPNWLTLGNQLEGTNLLEEDLVKAFKEHYPDGICRKPE